MAGRATSLAFSPLGSHLLAVDSACPGTTVRLVEIYSEDEIIFGKRTGFERVGAAFSNDGSMVAITDGFSEAVFWDAESGRKLITPGASIAMPIPWSLHRTTRGCCRDGVIPMAATCWFRM